MLSISKIFRNIGDAIPARLNVGIMVFFITFISYILRANLSMHILGMTHNSNDTADYGPRYHWTKGDEAVLLGAYFWGSFVTTMPAGILAEWCGGKLVTLICLIISTLLTALSPIMADWSFYALFFNRVVLGMVGGLFYPAMHNIVSKWAPPNEKGKFVAALLGGNLGTVFIWQLSGVVMVKYGWAMAFYGTAMITFLITCAWLLLVADEPGKHPRITPKERSYIEQSLGGNVSKKKAFPPLLKIATSLPFISLLVLHYGSLWGLFFLLTAAPKFMKEVLHYNLTSAGILASLPHLARFLFGFVFGNVGDFLRQKNVMSATAMRKFFCIFSHIIPGLLLISITYVGDNAYACIAIITASLGSNGSAALTNLVNSQDLAPNFAGTLYAIMNFIATSSGFLSPLVVSYFTRNGSNSVDDWSIIFWIGGIFYIVPAIFFWIFGTAEVQPWNKIGVDVERNEESLGTNKT